jgi:hypothetical protein
MQGTAAAPPAQAPITISIPSQGTPQTIYRALVSQRDVLAEQLRSAQRLRESLINQMSEGRQTATLRSSLEKRVLSVDDRIASLDKQIQASDQAVAQAAALPGATTRPPTPPQTSPDMDLIAGLSFTVVLVFAIPLSIAFARRVWRRSARAEVVLPPQMIDRMESIERGMDAIALEVERIGEGQRFLTQTMTDRVPIKAIGAEVEARR